MGNKQSHQRRGVYGFGENDGKEGRMENGLSNKRHSMKEHDSGIVNETLIVLKEEQQQGNKSPETTPSLALDKLSFTHEEHFRTDSSTAKRKSLPSNLKFGATPTPKIDSPGTEKFWFHLNTLPHNHSSYHPTTDHYDSNIFEKPSSIENDSSSHSSSLTGPRSSIFEEYISGITMDVISVTSPSIDMERVSSALKKDRKASPSAFQAITNYKNKKSSIIQNQEKEAKQRNVVSSNSNNQNVQTLIPKHLDEEAVDFSQPLMTPRHYKNNSIGLSNSVDNSISHLKHLICDDFVESGERNNLAVQSSREMNPESGNSNTTTTIVNNYSTNKNNHFESKNIPPLKLKQISSSNVGGALSAHSTPKNSPTVQSVISAFTTECSNSSGDISTAANSITNISTNRSTRSLPWFISPKSPTLESENCSPPPPTSANNAKRKSRTSVSDIKGGDIDSLREQIRNFDQQYLDELNNYFIIDKEPPVKYWDEIEEEEQDRKRKSLNAIFENFEHLQNIDLVIPRGPGASNHKRGSSALSSVICGNEQSHDIKNSKRSSVNLSNIVLTDKNGEQTIITPETSGALFGRGDSSISNFDVSRSSEKKQNNRRHSLRQSLSQSFNNKRRSATAFLNSKLFKL